MCPGMFNALNGLGGSGQLDPSTTNDANTALYSAFCLSSLLGGAIVNMFGVRITTSASCLTYALYTATYLYYNHTHQGALTIVAGGVLGIGAGILWTAQGVIMVSYPNEQEKGKYISIFWVIFNLGGVIGGLLPFALNYHRQGPLTDSVYVAVVVLECLGAVLALTLVPSGQVIRDDGSHTTVMTLTYKHVGREYREMLGLFTNRWILLLLPMSFASNFFYSYQFSTYNGNKFTLRTRGFNNLLYWMAQIIGSLMLSQLLDCQRWSRRRRGMYAMILMSVVFNLVWLGTLLVQINAPNGLIDFLDTQRAALPIFMYICMGLSDAWYQNLAYWLIGTLTNDAHRTARYIGFFKAIQSIGAAVAWQLAARQVPALYQVICNWLLLVISLPTMFWVAGKVSEWAQDDRLLYGLARDDTEMTVFGWEVSTSQMSNKYVI